MNRTQIKKLVEDQLTQAADKITDLVLQAVVTNLTGTLALPEKRQVKVKAKPIPKDPRAGVLCISGCGKTSLGPRWSYLCADHKGAPKKDIAKWKAARKQTQADAKGMLLNNPKDLKRFNNKRSQQVKDRYQNGHAVN